MRTVVCYLTVLIILVSVKWVQAQDLEGKDRRIAQLEKKREEIKSSEREALKLEVEMINKRMDSGDLTKEEAALLKMNAAEKHARNIENRLIIIDNTIALIQRNDYISAPDSIMENRFSGLVEAGKKGLKIQGKNKPVPYDIRSSNDLLFAIGFNNALIEGESLEDSPYKIGGSGFVELGWNWKTRILKNSNFFRLKYGLSLQWNKLHIKDNQYFVQQGPIVSLAPFPETLKKSKFRTTHLVIPVYLELGPSRKIVREDRIRYLNIDQFKIGVGGFAGVNLATKQKLIYNKDGVKIKDKNKQGFDTSDFVYGIGGYIGLGDVSLYTKYNLSPIFKNQDIRQNNISVGLRLDFD